MAQTPSTNSATLLSAAEFLKRCDLRTVADLCSDTDEPVAEASLAADPNLAAALLDATGEVEAAAMRGGRYTPADLAALTGATQARMRRMIARITMGLLYERRPDKGEPAASYKLALEQLELLRQGEMIFGTVEAADAQIQDHEVENAATVEARNGTSFIARRYFGRRSNREE